MKKLILALLSIVLSIGLIYCGKDSAGDYACKVKNIDQCVVYSGSIFTKAIAEKECSMARGSLEKGACPGDKMVGKCTLDKGTSREIIQHFYGPLFNTRNSQEACETMGGVFAEK